MRCARYSLRVIEGAILEKHIIQSLAKAVFFEKCLAAKLIEFFDSLSTQPQM
jgi:hypothetical protein